MKHRTARCRMHKADEVAPREALFDWCDGTVPVAAPYLLEDRFQADAMLVDCPEFHRGRRKRRRHFPQQRAQAGLELGLRQEVGVHVARSGLAPAGAEPPQIAPARVPAHCAPNARADPGGHGAPAPAVALGMCTGYRVAQLRSLLLREQETALHRLAPPVAHAVGAITVVAAGDLADPVGRVARHCCHGGGCPAARQEPEEVPAAALDGVAGLTVARFQLVVG